MGKKIVFYKGVRLWEVFKFWRPVPTPRGSDERVGISRKFAKITSRHRNYIYDITVHTHMEVRSETISDLGPQAKHNLGMLSCMKALIDNAADGSLGDLSWCENSDSMIVPGSSGGSYPSQQVIAYTGAGFVPAVGDKVLIREPVGGAGWVSHVHAVVPGVSIRLDLQQAVNNTWEIYKLFAYFPDTEYINTSGWDNGSQSEDKHALDVIYAFKSGAHPAWAAAYALDIS